MSSKYDEVIKKLLEITSNSESSDETKVLCIAMMSIINDVGHIKCDISKIYKLQYILLSSIVGSVLMLIISKVVI